MTSDRSWEELKQIRQCGVYFLPDAVYVASSARTVPGYCIDSEPIFQLQREISDLELGEAVIRALNSFRIDVDPPNSRRKTTSPPLTSARVKSWKQLERNALLVEISLDRDVVHIMPTERDAGGGYKHRPDLGCECRLEPTSLGATALRVLERCS